MFRYYNDLKERCYISKYTVWGFRETFSGRLIVETTFGTHYIPSEYVGEFKKWYASY